MKKINITLDNDLWSMIEGHLSTNDESIQDFAINAIRESLMKTEKKKKGKFTFIDLFAGIGGMRLAYESVGGHCLYSSEWNKYSQKTYFANFGELPDGDIMQEKSLNMIFLWPDFLVSHLVLLE